MSIAKHGNSVEVNNRSPTISGPCNHVVARCLFANFSEDLGLALGYRIVRLQLLYCLRSYLFEAGFAPNCLHAARTMNSSSSTW